MDTIDLAGSRISEKIECIINEVEKLPSLGMFFFERNPEIDLKNPALIEFFLGILKHDPHISAYYLGQPDGSYLVTMKFSQSDPVPHPFTPAPKGAVFVVLTLDRSISNSSQISFYDHNFQFLSTREFTFNYDPIKRPWYKGAANAKTLYWTDLYTHYFENAFPGLSVAVPFYDKSGQLISIIGEDLSFNLFSQFFQEQHIAKNGKAFVLDERGGILFPEGAGIGVETDIVAAAYKNFEKAKNPNFSYEFKKETYLASIHPFPFSYDKHWIILYLAPLSDFFADFLSTQRDAVLISLGVLMITALLVAIVSIHISKPIVQIVHEIDRIARLDLESKIQVHSHIAEIGLIDASVSSMRNALRSFAHYVPKELAKQLMNKEHEIALGGEMKTISIFFTDIAHFTAIAEMFPIEKVNSLLTEYFEILSKVIIDCGGTIDKYIGDSIMSIWGAPDDLPDFAARACKAALLCQKKLAALHEQRREKKLPLFETRMGIATGLAYVGNFGTSERMNYSAIGDSVNTAARLQGLNKKYHTHIIIGEVTMRAVGPGFLVRPLEIVEVRGKKNKLKIFELVALDQEPEISPAPEQIELCRLFSEAYETFEKGELGEAKKLFQTVHEKFPDDYPSKLYLDKLRSFFSE